MNTRAGIAILTPWGNGLKTEITLILYSVVISDVQNVQRLFSIIGITQRNSSEEKRFKYFRFYSYLLVGATMRESHVFGGLPMPEGWKVAE